jgi:hypothetical protein
MATATEFMSTRNPVTVDLAAGWSLLTTKTMETTDGTLTVRAYVSSLPKKLVVGTLVSRARGATRFAGYLDVSATSLTTTMADIATVIAELQRPFTPDEKLRQDVLNTFAATTEAGA